MCTNSLSCQLGTCLLCRRQGLMRSFMILGFIDKISTWPVGGWCANLSTSFARRFPAGFQYREKWWGETGREGGFGCRCVIWQGKDCSVQMSLLFSYWPDLSGSIRGEEGHETGCGWAAVGPVYKLVWSSRGVERPMCDICPLYAQYACLCLQSSRLPSQECACVYVSWPFLCNQSEMLLRTGAESDISGRLVHDTRSDVV